MQPGLFVTATDTDVGKTVLSASLIAAIAATGRGVRAHKPVLTGFQDPVTPLDHDAAGARVGGRAWAGARAGEWPPDHEVLAAVARMAPEEVAPLRFAPAVSPHLAAELSGERIDPGALIDRACRTRAHARACADEILVVEGVGGLLTPLAHDYTVRDFARALALPLLVAAHPGLGTVSHTLLTLECARAALLDVRAVVLTPWPRRPSTLERSNRETIARLGEVEVCTLERICGPDPRALARAGAALPWERWIGRSRAYEPRDPARETVGAAAP